MSDVDVVSLCLTSLLFFFVFFSKSEIESEILFHSSKKERQKNLRVSARKLGLQSPTKTQQQDGRLQLEFSSYERI